jgi:hypothetical protein
MLFLWTCIRFSSDSFICLTKYFELTLNQIVNFLVDEFNPKTHYL